MNPLNPFGLSKRDFTELTVWQTANKTVLIIRAGSILLFLLVLGVVYLTGADAELQEMFKLNPDLTIPLR